jgi:excisionase family DNA binding protein
MLTVTEAARLAGKHPETIRRWIRSGRLPATKVGARYAIERSDLERLLDVDELPVPADWGWDRLPDGRPMPNVVATIRRQRARSTDRRPRWVSREAFLRGLAGRQADAALLSDLRELVPGTTDDEPLA